MFIVPSENLQGSAFSSLIGNQRIQQFLYQAIQTQAIHHSLLFSGPEGVGKSLFARAFAQELLFPGETKSCHPDLRIYSPEGKTGMHSLDAIRQFSEEVYMAPFSAKWKLFIFQEADRMMTYGANALLKTLEEPAEHSRIILITHKPHALLPTIRSRCQTVLFESLTQEDVAYWLQKERSKTEEEARQIAPLAQGSLSRAEWLIHDSKRDLRKRVLDLLNRYPSPHYAEIYSFVTYFSKSVEEWKKEKEVEVRKSLMKEDSSLTAVQKDQIEKEVEGKVAIYMQREAQILFEIVAYWYRDLHLIYCRGNGSYLIHSDAKEQLDQRLQRGSIPSLERIEKILGKLQLLLDRSTSLVTCAESLFLQLESSKG